MTTQPVKHPDPAPRESEELFKRALARARAAKDALRDDPRRLTPPALKPQ